MKMTDLLDRISSLKQTGCPGDMLVPPPELIAFNVRITRRLLNLKKSALAHLAGISLSTVERVENAESVSPECLDKIAVAFGEQPGYFTSLRPLQVTDEAAADFSEKFGMLESVPVRHLSTQVQVRELAGCQSFMVNAPDLDDLKEEILGLVEWLDLAAFVISPLTQSMDRDEGGRRQLYTDVLNAVVNLEKQGVTVLAGIMRHSQHGIEDWKIALLNITRKSADPGAINRKFVFVDKRAVMRSAAHFDSGHRRQA